MEPTAFVHHFPVAGVHRLINAARRAAAFPEDFHNGWRKSPVDPSALLNVFAALRLRHGYALRAYAFRDDGNGNAFVYATPVDSAFAEPEDCLRDPNRFLAPPVPPGALSDVMEAIDGDGSPLAYLSASLFARELREFGAQWHGCDWNTHTILGENPLTGSAPEMMTVDADQWTWIEAAPVCWLPTVVSAHPVGVCFYTHTALDVERIVRHVDRFERNSYRFETEETDIARGRGGFIF
jgi:hypothetical protein